MKRREILFGEHALRKNAALIWTRQNANVYSLKMGLYTPKMQNFIPGIISSFTVFSCDQWRDLQTGTPLGVGVVEYYRLLEYNDF